MKINRHLLFLPKKILSILLQRETRSTWAYPLDYGAALAYSILSMPFPLGLPCGRPALEPPRRDETQRLFHVPRSSQDGLGPLCTPAVQHSRWATLESPNLTAYHFGPSLDQPRWLVLGDDACECLINLTIPSDSSADTRIEASRLTTLPGRLQTLGSGLRRPPNACSHRIPAAKSRA